MKVIEKYNQMRRDCWIDMECEGCRSTQTYKSAYDDRNFWDNVVPNFKCEKCGESTNTLGVTVEKIETKYQAHEVV